MTGGFHHFHIGARPTPAPIRTAAFPSTAAAPDCEQAAEPLPLPPAAAACSPLSSSAPCNDCPGTPARRCCLVLAARPDLWITEGIVDQFALERLGFNAFNPTAPIAGKFQNLTAPIGEAV